MSKCQERQFKSNKTARLSDEKMMTSSGERSWTKSNNPNTGDILDMATQETLSSSMNGSGAKYSTIAPACCWYNPQRVFTCRSVCSSIFGEPFDIM